MIGAWEGRHGKAPHGDGWADRDEPGNDGDGGVGKRWDGTGRDEEG